MEGEWARTERKKERVRGGRRNSDTDSRRKKGRKQGVLPLLTRR